jgi:hypothetical protein
MRRPVQCDGIERGPERTVQVGVVATVQPQFAASLIELLRRPEISPTIRYIT